MTTPVERPHFLTKLGDEFERVAREEAAQSRAPRRSVRVRTMVLAGMATLLLVGGAGAATGIVPFPGDGPQFVPQEATGHFDSVLADHVSVLSRTRTAEDSMGSAAAFVAGGNEPAPGSSLRVIPPPPPADALHASTTTLNVWLLPTSSGEASIEVLSPGSGADGPASGFSADLQMVDEGHAFMTLDDDLVGLVPDGVSAVTVALKDGAREVLPVVGNVYGAHFDEGIQSVAFATP